MLRTGDTVRLHYRGADRDGRVVATYPDRGQVSVVMLCDGNRLALPVKSVLTDATDNSGKDSS